MIYYGHLSKEITFKVHSYGDALISSLYAEKEAIHERVKSIIEEQTQHKLKREYSLELKCIGDHLYMYYPLYLRFENDPTYIPGLKYISRYNKFKFLKSKKESKIILSRIENEVSAFSTSKLKNIGIYTDNRNYDLIKIISDEFTRISLIINPLYLQIDIEKAYKNGMCAFRDNKQ